MGIPDPDISNGDCYYIEGGRLDKAFIPCGNDDLGHKPCCQAGDVCLENNACYNADYGTTYIAGCTDGHYEDSSCPQKSPWDGSKWLGLIYMSEDRWGICHQRAEPSLLQSPDPCPRPTPPSIGTYVIAFSAGPHIPDVGRLPLSLGGSISWDSEHIPDTPTGSFPASTTTTNAPSSTTTQPNTTQPSTTPPSRATTTTPATTASQDNTTSQTDANKGGVNGSTATIVGIVLGVVLFVLIAAGSLIYYRRRHREDVTPVMAAPGDGGAKFNSEPPHHPHGPREPTLPVLPAELPPADVDLVSAAKPYYAELDSNPPRWSTSPSELYGGSVQNSSPSNGFGHSNDLEGLYPPHTMADARLHIGNPTIGSPGMNHPGPPVGIMNPHTGGFLPTPPDSGVPAFAGPAPDFRGSLISSDGTPAQSPTRFTSVSPMTSTSSPQPRQSPNAYPGQPQPYQPYRPQPQRGQYPIQEVEGTPPLGAVVAASDQQDQTKPNPPGS